MPSTRSLEDKFGSLQLIDVVAETAAVTEQWVNQTLTTVNDSLVRLGVVEGEFHWHKHDAEDEFFYVVWGDLELEVEGPSAPDSCSPPRNRSYVINTGRAGAGDLHDRGGEAFRSLPQGR